MDFLEKIQALPEPKRKIIFWTVLLVLSFLLLLFWLKNARVTLEKLRQEEIEKQIVPPSLLKDIQLPEINIEEDLKKLEELMEKENGSDESSELND